MANVRSFLAFGNHTVRSLLNSSYFTFKKIILLDKYNKDRELISLIDSKKIPYQFLDKVSFSRYGFDKKNQGIVAFLKEYSYVSLSSLLQKKSQRKFPFLLMLDSIEDPHNLGAIVRTCAAFQLDGIIIANKNQVPVNGTVVKVSMGGIAYVPACRVNNLLEAINELKKSGYKIVSSVCQTSSQVYNRSTFNFPVCLVLGNEHDGIRSRIIKKSDMKIYIPMSKHIPSLNVAVSGGIMISEIISQ